MLSGCNRMLDKLEYLTCSAFAPPCLPPRSSTVSFPVFVFYGAQSPVCPFEYMDALFILQFPIHLRKQMLLKPASSESSFQPAPMSVIIAQRQRGTGWLVRTLHLCSLCGRKELKVSWCWLMLGEGKLFSLALSVSLCVCMSVCLYLYECQCWCLYVCVCSCELSQRSTPEN